MPGWSISDVARASGYIGASVVLGVVALWVGMAAGRMMRSAA